MQTDKVELGLEISKTIEIIEIEIIEIEILN